MKISAKQYASTLYDLTSNKGNSEINDVIVKFVAHMKKTGNLKKSQDVVKQFRDIYNKNNNIIEADVISARTLTDDEQVKIKSFIKNKYKADNVLIHDTVKKDIKGGIIIKVGDEVLDGSVMRKLNKLKMSLR